MSNNLLMLDADQDIDLRLKLEMKLRRALWRAKYTNDDIERLCAGNMLANVRGVFLNEPSARLTRHTIDSDKDPMAPDGWEVKEHEKGGKWKWDSAQVSLHPFKREQDATETAGMLFLNATELDYLLVNPRLIPEEWKDKTIVFRGTRYCDSSGRLFVRAIYWQDGEMWNSYNLLDGDWDGDCFDALRATEHHL